MFKSMLAIIILVYNHLTAAMLNNSLLMSLSYIYCFVIGNDQEVKNPDYVNMLNPLNA